MRFAIFYHVAQMNYWRPVVSEQLECVRRSGILDAAEEFQIGVNGNEAFWIPPEARIVTTGNPLTACEFPTLALVEAWSRRNPDAAVVYFHSKGVSHDTRDPWPLGSWWDDWRRALMWAVVERWRECLAALADNRESVGPTWHRGCWTPPSGGPPTTVVKTGFWAGNFWWARSSYILRLPSVLELDHANRNEAEAWIGKAPSMNGYEIHNWCGHNYCPEFYRETRTSPYINHRKINRTLHGPRTVRGRRIKRK